MARTMRNKVTVTFAPAPPKPDLQQQLLPIPWFRLPRQCYLHMVLNPTHVRNPDETREPAVRTVTAVRTHDVAVHRAGEVADGDDRCSEYSDSDNGSAFSDDEPGDCIIPPPPTVPSGAEDEGLEPAPKRQRHTPVVDVDADADRVRLQQKIKAMADVVDVPRDIDNVPLHRLRELYDTNRRCVQVESLVKWYSAALLLFFVAVDVLSENIVGVDMDKYVELQVNQMHIYRHHLRRIAEKQVANARTFGIFSENQSPAASIMVTFLVTTIGFLAVRVFLRERAPSVVRLLAPLFGRSTAATSAAPQQTSPMTTLLSIITSASVPPQQSAPQPRMAHPDDVVNA
jgi:hypothetical protein